MKRRTHASESTFFARLALVAAAATALACQARAGGSAAPGTGAAGGGGGGSALDASAGGGIDRDARPPGDAGPQGPLTALDAANASPPDVRMAPDVADAASTPDVGSGADAAGVRDAASGPDQTTGKDAATDASPEAPPSGLQPLRFALPFTLGAAMEVIGLAVGDVTGDGRPDLVALASEPTAEVLVFAQRASDGSLDEPTRLPLDDRANGTVVALGDLDGDGRLDIVVGGGGGLRIAYRRDAGLASFLDPLPGVAPLIYDLVCTDFDGDGATDVVTVSIGAIGPAWFRQQGGELSRLMSRTVPIGYFAKLAVGAVDGDDRLDVVVGGGDSAAAQLAVLPGRPDGTFGTPVIHALGDRVILSGLGLGDLDGDGRLDFAGAHGDGADSALTLLFQAPAGGLGAPVRRRLPFSPQALVVADVDGDQRTDALVVYGHRLGVYRQLADRTLAPEELFELLGTDTSRKSRAVVVADLDGDGKKDLAAAAQAGMTVMYQR